MNHPLKISVTMVIIILCALVPMGTAQAVPATPSGLTALHAYATEVALKWNDNASDEVQYIVARMEPAVGGYHAIATLPANSDYYVDSSVSPGVTYNYMVFCANGDGNSARSEEIPVYVPNIDVNIASPASPTDPYVSHVGMYDATLHWTDNAADESYSSIERRGDWESAFRDLGRVDPNVNRFRDTGLMPGLVYHYRVVVMNGRGVPSYSAEVVFTTPSTEPVWLVPAAPTLLTVTQSAGFHADLDWHDNSIDEDYFSVERKGPGESDYHEIARPLAGKTGYRDTTDLAAGETYYYRVRAGNENGWSGYTDEVALAVVDNTASPPTTTVLATVLKYFIGQAHFYLNDAYQSMDTAPVLNEGRTLLPIRFVAEPLGGSAEWSDTEQKVTVYCNHHVIELWIGSNIARVDGLNRMIDPENPNVRPITIPPGRTMMPLRFIAESLGCDVAWDEALNQATVTYPPSL